MTVLDDEVEPDCADCGAQMWTEDPTGLVVCADCGATLEEAYDAANDDDDDDDRWDTCSTCGGSGGGPDIALRCPSCAGSGESREVERRRREARAEYRADLAQEDVLCR